MKKFWKYLLALLLVLIVIAVAFLFRPITSKAIKTKSDEPVVDVVLIGGGIMSATLGAYLNELQPDWNVRMYERLDAVAQESSNGFNNAGTGHSGFMEMNYTEEKDGKMDVSKAVNVASQFEIAKQFWAHQVKQGVLGTPNSFINPVPHIAFVWGDNVQFMEKRYAAMIQEPLFAGMKITEDPAEVQQCTRCGCTGEDP